MDLSLTPELEKRVHEKLASGLYSSPSDVVREALRLYFELDDIRRRQLEELNRQIDIGLAEAERGEVLTAEESQRRIEAKLSEFARLAR